MFDNSFAPALGGEAREGLPNRVAALRYGARLSRSVFLRDQSALPKNTTPPHADSRCPSGTDWSRTCLNKRSHAAGLADSEAPARSRASSSADALP